MKLADKVKEYYWSRTREHKLSDIYGVINTQLGNGLAKETLTIIPYKSYIQNILDCNLQRTVILFFELCGNVQHPNVLVS